MLSIIARSTGQGRYAGMLSCLGIATGGLIQTCVVALGLSSVFLLVPIVYETMKGIGAISLIYVGTRTRFSQQEAWADPGQEKAGATRVFLQGTFTTLLNPKAAFFYFALLPQFVDPTQGNEPPRLFMLGLLANMTG